ncbi:conjugal transfer protein TrbL [Microbacterium sp. No. 7]|uniref:conjugal transfer protein TrbL n=1 Tax=Microbacterium sp. No. 7 TaxID=1714373 RepID=UPI0006D1154B|nr:conjugal transfer protein TrbL [Microbacterium sp. No. 7]
MSVCDAPLISSVCDAAAATAGAVGGSVVEGTFAWVAAATGAAAAWMFEAVWVLFETTTLVDVTAPHYVRIYNILFGIAVLVMIIFFLFQLITGMVRREPGALVRAALGLARSVLGSFLVLTLTATLLEIVDQLTIGIIQASGHTVEEMGGRIALLLAGLGALSLPAPGAAIIVTIFLASMAVAAAGIVWFSLLIRKCLLLVAIVLAPLALSGGAWEFTRGWVSKWALLVVALIFSKLVMAVVFLIAVGQMSAPIDLDLASLAEPVSGIVLMLIAGFAPYLVYKLVSFVGFDLYAATSTEQEAKQAVNRPIPIPHLPQSLPPRGSGGSPAPTPAPAASAEGTAAAGVGTPAAGAGAAQGGGSGAAAPATGSTGAAGGAGAAVPVAAGVVAAVEVARATAGAGRAVGATVGADVTGHADAATRPSGAVPPREGVSGG